MTKNEELRVALSEARSFILNRHNMGARKREKQRIYVLRLISAAFNESNDGSSK